MILLLFINALMFIPNISEDTSNEMLVFEGVMSRIGPPPGYISGGIPAYRLAEYRIKHIISGHYEGRKIIVDHLILTGKELDGIKVGDKVCVTVRTATKIDLRVNAKGMRSASQPVKIFYIGEKIDLSGGGP